MSNDDRQGLLDKANELGLEFPKNITTEKLKEMVNSKISDDRQQDNLSDSEVKDGNKIEMSQEQFTALMKEMEELKKSNNVDALKAEIEKLKSNGNNDSDSQLTSHNSMKALAEAISDGISGGNLNKTKPGIKVNDTVDRDKKILKAKTLIRCIVIPRDPAKVSYTAEVFTVTNDLIGELRYKVPFNVETHIPYAIYKALKSKKCMIFDQNIMSGDTATGQVKGGYREAEAYSINNLSKLTKSELKALARKQKLRSDNLEDREDELLGIKDVEKEEKSELAEYGL